YAEPVKLVTGLKMTTGMLIQLGERSYNMERMFNVREGMSSAEDSLPARLTSVPLDPNDPNTVVSLDKMLPEFYEARGWDEKGIPTAKKLKQLGIR
ncbi:MAG: aldehyde ferredoxin oxidoreductase C-terminal domain-containing protein, partial [Ignavibacteriales bacterium]